ncbi:GerAB/ArcD/ProY family transporter [Haloplasma contractile]|uniref:Spore germination protein KB n=1 Tax=Haloplasma contractile SSD-17B TaxID=1033810 RepID=U2E9G3_9MOLU|nr:GerAB/ArcD/ProY family transporter [Haloplasma contractile]ERJ11491.1 Spore germination protein KB [Haloplasma contractile SSD-17B]
MKLQKITPYQLFALIFIFEIGSAILFGLGFDAKQDAWLAILLALVGGVVVLLIYIWLYYRYPTLTFVNYTTRNLGFLGKIISHGYILYFLYIAARVIRDLGELTTMYLLPATPLLVINLLGLLIVGYALYLGIEVIARASEITIGAVYAFFTFILIIIMFSDLVKIENLLPILDNGFMNVLKAAYPQIVTFPFGELIVFTMIFPHLNKKNKLLKTSLLSLLLVGLTLSFISALIYSVIGGSAMSCTFPFVCVVRLVNVAEFIQRFEGSAIIFLLAGGLAKITLFMYAALIGFQDIYKTNDYRPFLLPSLVLVLFLSIMIAGHLAQHLEIGLKIVTYYIHLPLQIGIPLIVLLISLIKRDKLKDEELDQQ